MAKERKPGAYQNAVHEAYARNTNNTEYMGYMLLGAGGVIAAPLVLPMVVEGAVFVSPYVANGAVQTGRFAWNFAKQPFVAAGGSYGPGAQTIAISKLINTGADATGQIIDLSINGGNWNIGSTFGNLYFTNPFISSAPGALYDGLTNPNATTSSVLTNYFLNAGIGYGGSRLPLNRQVGFNFSLFQSVGGTQLSRNFEQK